MMKILGTQTSNFKMNKIITSGCSYSTNTGSTPYSIILGNSSNDVYVENKAWPGQSNQSILRQIRNDINSGITDTTFICQLTPLHRLSIYCNRNNDYIDFSPTFTTLSPVIKDGNIQFDIDFNNPDQGTLRGIGTYGATGQHDVGLSDDEYKELWNFYKIYLNYSYDDDTAFYNLIEMVDDMQRLVDITNNKILFLFWPNTISDIEELKKRNFINFDGEYSLLNWSVSKNILDGTSHLSQLGHELVAERLLNNLNLEKNRFI